MVYDRADWHSGGDYPKNLPPENGGTHIGMFLAWVINNHLEGELHRNESQESLAAVRERTLTGREFLVKKCDEKFREDDLNEEGNKFARYYYVTDQYYEDYASVLCQELPSLYHVEDTWENYDKLAPIISKRFNSWKKNKKWWQFWK